MFNWVLTIHVPALDRLVTYLENRDQQKIDALTETLAQGTKTLQQSTEGLKAAVTNIQ